MGTSWVDHPSWELVDQASGIVDRDVAELLLRADEGSLTKTANAQLATFVLSLVILDAAERIGLEPAACAGHSLGEYTALVATGALSYEDGLRLVAERGIAMQDAADNAPGSMMAVLGLTDDDVEAACARAEGDAWVANFNAPGQVVVAGRKDALDRVAKIARGLGAKRVASLPVGGAFHTPLMVPARERLRKALAEVRFHDADPVVVANVDARPHPDPADWPSLLSAQLCGPVRWRQSLESLHRDGARTFVELGPGAVLTGLVKRVLPKDGLRSFSVSTPQDLEVLAEALTGAEKDLGATQATPRTAERYVMTERLIVSPASGPFTPAGGFSAAALKLERSNETKTPLRVAVGDLVGHAGKTEIRSAFAGTLEGLLVLSGERVMIGQPVAWLRAGAEEEFGEAG